MSVHRGLDVGILSKPRRPRGLCRDPLLRCRGELLRLLLRVDPAETNRLLASKHVEPFEMRGRVMQGWLRVDPEGLRTKRQLERWVARGVAYARSLPSKQ